MNLTRKHLIIALYIRAGICSVRELNAALGNRSSGWISQYLRELRAMGLVSWSPGQARTLQLTAAGKARLVHYVLLPGGGVGEWESKEV